VILGIGVDLVHIPRIRQAIERWQERFLDRVFTADEVAYARRRRDPAEHLAARFAAKEATLKALGTGLTMGVRWREMEVRRARGGPPTLSLSGRTAAIGTARGVRALHLSLTHDGDYALAQVVAEGGSGETA
jgi:holo-[acyl-carrier protein] synthase